jgi:hypothetical protein
MAPPEGTNPPRIPVWGPQVRVLVEIPGPTIETAKHSRGSVAAKLRVDDSEADLSSFNSGGILNTTLLDSFSGREHPKSPVAHRAMSTIDLLNPFENIDDRKPNNFSILILIGITENFKTRILNRIATKPKYFCLNDQWTVSVLENDSMERIGLSRAQGLAQ